MIQKGHQGDYIRLAVDKLRRLFVIFGILNGKIYFMIHRIHFEDFGGPNKSNKFV